MGEMLSVKVYNCSKVFSNRYVPWLVGEETHRALKFLLGAENVHWKLDGRKMSRIQVIGEGRSCLAGVH